jgi:hypothetical protein
MVLEMTFANEFKIHEGLFDKEKTLENLVPVSL